jgi:hypothetical protein
MSIAKPTRTHLRCFSVIDAAAGLPIEFPEAGALVLRRRARTPARNLRGRERVRQGCKSVVRQGRLKCCDATFFALRGSNVVGASSKHWRRGSDAAVPVWRVNGSWFLQDA